MLLNDKRFLVMFSVASAIGGLIVMLAQWFYFNSWGTYLGYTLTQGIIIFGAMAFPRNKALYLGTTTSMFVMNLFVVEGAMGIQWAGIYLLCNGIVMLQAVQQFGTEQHNLWCDLVDLGKAETVKYVKSLRS